MDMWRLYFDLALVFFNLVILSYFVLGNGVYTALMVISVRSIWFHSRRQAYQGLTDLRESSLTPAVTIIVPAWNEERIIVETVRSALGADYPQHAVIVVDDGSTDSTLKRLLTAFMLAPTSPDYNPLLPTSPVRDFYFSPRFPNLLVVHKQRGGKPDALNTGINLCRSPYFCCLDADCILERDSLLRLMEPILSSPREIIVSGGVVRIINGSTGSNGQVVKLGLPRTFIERFQVVEYLRSFLTGRNGWSLVGGTVIVSGALALFQHKAVVDVGGFSEDTVTEDMDLVITLRERAARDNTRVGFSFTSDPVCWTECPSTYTMLSRQRRRWQLGLCQCLRKHRGMLLRPRYGIVGMLSLPFHLYIEGLGTLVEFLGYLLVPLSFLGGFISPALLTLFILLGLAYGGFLSVGAVLLEEMTYRRYPRSRDLLVLLAYAMLENVGYRQLILFFRVQGILKFLVGSHRWEKVRHDGQSLTLGPTELTPAAAHGSAGK
ncbi:MAG: glycosyltransferase [Terriglobia bacterium]|jgi:cellulose synthase/poly-beta-1,6-N-acetylglucosamine synthase-like glycosyltransferase